MLLQAKSGDTNLKIGQVRGQLALVLHHECLEAGLVAKTPGVGLLLHVAYEAQHMLAPLAEGLLRHMVYIGDEYTPIRQRDNKAIRLTRCAH